MPHKTITYRRTQLYAQVWAEPIRNVAKRHGIAELRGLIANWREAQEIRAHVAACASGAADANLQLDASRPAAKWMKWASEHADRIDPLALWRVHVARAHRGAPQNNSGSRPER